MNIHIFTITILLTICNVSCINEKEFMTPTHDFSCHEPFIMMAHYSYNKMNDSLYELKVDHLVISNHWWLSGQCEQQKYFLTKEELDNMISHIKKWKYKTMKLNDKKYKIIKNSFFIENYPPPNCINKIILND